MSIRVELELDDGSFTTRMIHAGETVAQFQNNVNGTITSVNRLNEANTSFLTTLRDVTVTLGMMQAAIGFVRGATTGWAGDIIQVNGEMERLRFLLAGFSKSAEPMKEAADQVKYLRDFAKDAPFSLQALSDTFVKMKSTGIDPMKGALKGLVDGVAAFGGTDETLKRATIAIQQMSGKGVIQMEELRQQLGEAMPRAVELMARSMGVSTGQLIQEISKGTLDAKTSLQAFNMELERTFGGAAAQQMNTFNGMISRTKTLMQNLALDIGNAGFFDAVKTQVKAINDALSGDMMAKMSSTLGQGLGQFVNYVAQAVGWVIQFRDEILKVGEALALAFASSIAAKGILSLGAAIQSMRAEMSILLVQTNMFRAAFNGVGSLWTGLRTGADAMAALSLTTQAFGNGLMRVLPILATGLTFIAGWVPLLVAAFGALYLVMGQTATESEKAYESLAKYGAESRKQVQEATGYLDVLRAKIALMEQLKVAQEQSGTFDSAGGEDPSQAIARLEKELADAQSKLADGKLAGAKKDAEKLIQVNEDTLTEQTRVLRSQYDQERSAASTAYTDQLKLLNDAHKDSTQLTKSYQDDKRAKDLAYYQTEKNLFAAQLVELQMMANQGNEDALLIMDKRSSQLFAKIADSQQKIETLTQMATKPVDIDKGMNVTKLLEQAKTKLDGLNSDIAGQKAELAGVSGEYARMAYLIQDAAAKSNSMWSLNNPEIQAVVKQLMDAQKETDTLQQKLNGLKSFDSDLSSAEANARQKYIEALTQGKSGLDAVAAKAQAGLYSGMTPIARMLAEVSTSANDAGKSMDGAFGAGMRDKGNSLVGIVERLGSAWKSVKNNAAGLPDASMSLDTTTFRPGSTYSQNLIRHESGGRADATNGDSTATGLGQFIEKTWMEFLKDMHPDMLSAGKQAALDARKDPKLSQEAVDWYAGKNADKLQKNGVDVNDSNLYLAHFLGPDGAIAALTKSSDTLLSSIPKLDGARASNPTIANMTVQQLKDWAASFMGPLMTASRSGSNTSSLGTVMGMTTTPGQQQSALNTQYFEDEAKRLTGDNSLVQFAKDYSLAIKEAGENEDKLNKHLATTRKLIQDGKFGQDRDPDSERYKTLIKLATDWDKADATANEQKRIRQKADAIRDKLPREQEGLDEKEGDVNRRLQDETKFKFTAQYYTQLKQSLKDIQTLQDDSKFHSGNQADNDRDIATLKSQMDKRRDIEVANAVATEQQKTIAVEQGLMTADAAREDVHKHEIARLNEFLKLYADNAAMRGTIEAQLARSKSAYDRATLAASPIAKQFKEWMDISNNLQKSAASWIDQTNSKLTDFIMTGKAKWADLATSIEKDFIQMGIRLVESKIFNMLAGNFLGGSGSVGTMNVGGQLFPAIHHSGGVAGSQMPTRSVNPLMFAGAQRYHTGTGGLTLGQDEIPIIAKRGEQVDWPENLAAQYGRGGSVISPQIAVTVQGSPGMSDAEHQRMGEKIGSAAMDQLRGLMNKEIATQLKPNGLLNRRS